MADSFPASPSVDASRGSAAPHRGFPADEGRQTGADIESRRHGPGQRRDRDRRAAPACLRGDRRPLPAAGLHRPLPHRLPPHPDRADRDRRRRALSRRRAAAARSGWTRRSSRPRRRTGWSSTAAAGRANRIPSTTLWELTEGPGGLTKVRVSYWTEPSNPVDRGLELLSAASIPYERRWREALRRLRDLLEAGGLERRARRGRRRQPPRDRYSLSRVL